MHIDRKFNLSFQIDKRIMAQISFKNDVGDELKGGSNFVTSHSLTHQLDSEDVVRDEIDIKEFHFHTYWFQNRQESYNAALRIQKELIAAIKNKRFVAVLPGITKDILPEIDISSIPEVNLRPIGPHPCGSFETWVPKEYFADVVSFFMQRRGELTILVHPLTRYEVEDHFARNMWIGPPMRLDMTGLENDTKVLPKQYPELKLGYSAEH